MIHKQDIVSCSSFGAEILAVADSDDMGNDVNNSSNSKFPNISLSYEILVDFCALFGTITIIHESKEYRLKM